MDAEPKIYILSGGAGASAEGVVQTVLAQFSGSNVEIVKLAHLRQREQLEKALAQSQEDGGLIVHTLVEPQLRADLIALCQGAGVPAIDLMGPLVEWLESKLGVQAAAQPGLYRRLRREYFERIDAIDYTMMHDDGKHPEGWKEADVMLAGPSRTGKTPLSLYLSVLGWKVANLPIVPGTQPPGELFELDPGKVVGLTIEPGQLILERQQRQQRLGAPGYSAYVDPEQVYEEVKVTRALYRRSGFRVINVTDKPIETIADEVIRILTRVAPPPI